MPFASGSNHCNATFLPANHLVNERLQDSGTVSDCILDKATRRRTLVSSSHPMDSLRVTSPYPLDLTNYIVKIQDQYVEGGGGFGDVYKCQLKSGSGTREVAVKAFRFKFTFGGEGIDRSAKIFCRELNVWKRLSHNNIVPFLGIAHGFGMRNSTSLVSLWMPNGTLQNFLVNYDNRLVNTHRLHLLMDIANGLHYLHSFTDPPIVHGDLNSNNVLLDADYTARLADFGYASLVGANSEALAHLSPMESRSFRWIVPEQVLSDSEGRFQKTLKSDIYSFGNIALQARPHGMNVGPFLIHPQVLSGKQPWSEIHNDTSVVICLAQGRKPERPKSRVIDDRHWELIKVCWSSVPEDRPTSEGVVSTIQKFPDYHSYTQPIRDLMVSFSRQSHTRVRGPTSSDSRRYTRMGDAGDDADWHGSEGIEEDSTRSSLGTRSPVCSCLPRRSMTRLSAIGSREVRTVR
ncbi:kinase-like domain-containing protein [Butyriboletus roseoflavus]|nr:kinase-like domain-containing protein [Butyriboletus roseoflavus]